MVRFYFILIFFSNCHRDHSPLIIPISTCFAVSSVPLQQPSEQNISYLRDMVFSSICSMK